MIYKLVDGKFEMKNRDEDTKKEEEAALERKKREEELEK